MNRLRYDAKIYIYCIILCNDSNILNALCNDSTILHILITL